MKDLIHDSIHLQASAGNLMDHPILNEQEKLELFHKYHDDEDFEARNELLLCHMRYIKSLALKFRNITDELMDDLVSAGVIGFIACLNTYQPELSSITTHARLWIIMEQQRLIRKNDTVVTPAHQDLIARRISKAEYDLQVEGNPHPNNEDIAERLGITILDVYESKVKGVSISSMDAELDFDEPGTGQHEILTSTDDVELLDILISEDNEMKVLTLLESLEREDRQLLCMRFGIGYESPVSLQDMIPNVSKQTAYNRVQAALKKLRKLCLEADIY